MKVEIIRAGLACDSRRTIEEFAKQHNLVLVVTARLDGMFTAWFRDTTPMPTTPARTIQDAIEQYAAHISGCGLRLPDESIVATPHFVVSRIYE